MTAPKPTIETDLPWLGAVPSHWIPMRLRDTVEGCVNGIWGNELAGDDTDVPVIRVADFDRMGRRTKAYQTVRSVPNEQRQSRALHKGDLLIEKSGGGELQPVGMVVQYTGDPGAVCSNFVARMRPREEADARYLTYLHAHLYEQGVTTLSIKQSTGIQNLDSTAYLGERCFLPPLREQTAIAAFLDSETARIDALIAEKGRLLRLIDELASASVNEAVTEGLQLTCDRRADQRTGLPRVPSHWASMGLIKAIDDIVDYRGRTPTKTDDGVFLVTARNIADGWIDYEASQEFISIDSYGEAMSRGAPELGDVLFTTEAPLGKVALVDRTDIALAQRVIKFRARADLMRNEFLMYWFMSEYMQQQLRTWSSGSTAEGIKASRLRRLPILVPPLPEQESICAYVGSQMANARELKAQVSAGIDALNELRATTITDAVLGRIDVRDKPTKKLLAEAAA